MTRRPFVLITLWLFVSSSAGAAEIRGRGLLDLVLSSGTEAREANRYTQGDSNFDPYRATLFLDAKVSPTLDVYLEAILHEGSMPIMADGAYAQWTPWPNRDAHLQAGKVPWPVGTWAARAYSDKNWLVGTPLLYQHHTSLAWGSAAPSLDALVAASGQGQYGLDYAGSGVGMPVVDDRWWDVGVVALGSQRPFEYSVGVVQGSPGWPESNPDDTPGQTTLGRFGVVPAQGVRLGASGAWGTWMPEWFQRRLPAGRTLRDYHEWLGMADVEAAGGPWELRGEGYLKGWQTHVAGTLRVGGGYGEARLNLLDGAWLAGRYETMRFSNVTPSSGERQPWDAPVDRLELGIGYRASRDVRLKAAFQRNTLHLHGETAEVSDLFALAASIRL